MLIRHQVTFQTNFSRQPDSHTTYDISFPTESLAELCGARSIQPIPTTISTILSEKVRTDCLTELASPNTFLTDVTINSFCVSSCNLTIC